MFTPESLSTKDVIADPYPAYAVLRPKSPVKYPHVPAGLVPGMDQPLLAWAVLAHADVFRVLRDHETFSSVRNPMVELGLIKRVPLLYDDPPRHSRLRRLVSQAFTSRRVEALEPSIAQLASAIVDTIESGESDAMARLAVPLPMIVIARLLGIPPEEFETFRKWSQTFLGFTTIPQEVRQRSFQEMAEYFSRMARSRRERPGDDLISSLVQASDEGHSLSEPDLIGFCVLLLIAGNDTTTNLIGNMLGILSKRPEIWRRLRSERSFVESVIEETLRFESPIQRLPRCATRAVEVSGASIAAGDYLSIFYGAANRDPAVFADPDTFLPERKLDNHLAFGTGIHFCLGAPLARAEARILLNILLDRFASIHPGESSPIRQTASFTVLGYERLPLLWKKV